jgi:hypothetical protein
MSAAGTPGNPFIGPRPFTVGQALYGRDWETRMLFNLLLSRRLVLLHSPSGAGKTSLIQAGLLPRLQDAFRIWPLIRVGAPPDPATTSSNRYISSTFRSLDPSGARDLSGGRLRDVHFGGDDKKPELWIFDQFEEVLSLGPMDDAARRQFFEQLAEAFERSDQPRWALFAIREDYLGAMEPFLELLPTGLSARFRLELLDADAARDAIQVPVRREGLEVTDAAARKLVDDLRRIRIPGPDGSIVEQLGPHVEPVHLQVVCHRLWERRDPAAASIMPDGVEDVGDVDTALADYYAEQVAAIAAATGVPERTIREWFERRLITADRVRGQVMKGKDQGLADTVMRPLVDAYLIREEPRPGRPSWYELTHDRLIEPIHKNNGAWRKQHLEPFQLQAAQWASNGRPPKLLLREAELARATRWRRERPGELTVEEKEFLDKSEEALRRAELGTNLADVGWGVIFARDADPAVREALSELLEHRRGQAGEMRESRYREFSGPEGRKPEESTADFLRRHGAGMGLTDPDTMPYYLLIVGGPDTIPYEFQYQLDVRYAVGRINFPTLEEYAAYARSVVTAESSGYSAPRQAVIFSPAHTADLTTDSTAVTTRLLSLPMAARLERTQPDWAVQTVVQHEATKARLARLLGGEETPSVLFTASHGIGFPNGHPLQFPHQGAILCQDWSGSTAGQPILPGQYFAAEDVGDDARLLGLIAFLSASFSAGTPIREDFVEAPRQVKSRRQIAPSAFMARLPQRLLGHPHGGALAVIGHVERSWTSSFVNEGGPDIRLFESTLRRLMRGHTVGSSMEAFNQRYAQLSVTLAQELRDLLLVRASHELRELDELADMDIFATDIRNYIVLGDPAVRLPIGDGSVVEPERPTIQPMTVTRQRIEVSPEPSGLEEGLGDDVLVFNGVNGATSDYLLPPMTAEQMAAVALEDFRPRYWYTKKQLF